MIYKSEKNPRKRRTMTSNRIIIAALLFGIIYIFLNLFLFLRDLTDKTCNCISFEGRGEVTFTKSCRLRWFIRNERKKKKNRKKDVTFFFLLFFSFIYSCPPAVRLRLYFPNVPINFRSGRGGKFHRKKRFFFVSRASNWIKEDNSAAEFIHKVYFIPARENNLIGNILDEKQI